MEQQLQSLLQNFPTTLGRGVDDLSRRVGILETAADQTADLNATIQALQHAQQHQQQAITTQGQTIEELSAVIQDVRTAVVQQAGVGVKGVTKLRWWNPWTHTAMNISALQAFDDEGRDVRETPAGTVAANGAHGAVITSSGLLEGSAPAERVWTGNRWVSAFNHPDDGCFHTKGSDENASVAVQYWQIEFASPVNLTSLVLYNRADDCKHRWVGTMLQMFGADKKLIKAVAVPTEARGCNMWHLDLTQ